MSTLQLDIVFSFVVTILLRVGVAYLGRFPADGACYEIVNSGSGRDRRARDGETGALLSYDQHQISRGSRRVSARVVDRHRRVSSGELSYAVRKTTILCLRLSKSPSKFPGLQFTKKQAFDGTRELVSRRSG